ncbi:MAG: tetratricopeptide repeat protein [Desulforhopalus sp.]
MENLEGFTGSRPSFFIGPHLPMIQSSLKTVIICQFLFFFSFILGLPGSECLADNSIAPDRNISMVQGEPEQPEWKILWDRARHLTRSEDYLHAVKSYAELYSVKPNIEEANWEYCKALLKVGKFSTASKIIGILLDENPNNIDYLLAGGAIAAHWGNYETAVSYYGKVLEHNPTGQDSDTALLGLATSLRNQGEKQLSFALLEQLSIRHPENNTIIHYLASDAYDLGKVEKSRKLYTRLLQGQEVDDEIIFQAAGVFDVPGYEKERNSLWLRHLERHPDYLPFRQRLVQFYIENGAPESALAQLKYLADHSESNDDFLLKAGNLCQRDLTRPDLALSYFERYYEKNQEDLIIKKRIAEIQSILAKDLHATVENSEASQLWKDLKVLTRNPLPIFLELADILENNEQTEKLIEILTIIYAHSSSDEDIALRIADKYSDIDEHSQALNYLTMVTGKKSTTKSFHLFKGKTEEQLGLDLEALASFQRGLSLDPLDMSLRKKCLTLAGETGNVNSLIALFNGGLKQWRDKVSPDFVFTYLDLLSFNFLFQEYAKIDSWARYHFAGVPEIITRLDIHKASSLRKAGKTRQAEQILRQLLNNDILVDEVLFQLAENALFDGNYDSAESWYQALQNNSIDNSSHFSINIRESRLILLKVTMLKAEKNYGAAIAHIDNYLNVNVKADISDELIFYLNRLNVQHCWLTFYKGHLSEAYEQCKKNIENGNDDPELLVLSNILNTRFNQKDRDIEKNRINSIARLLALALKEMEYREYDSAENHLDLVLQKYPQSVAGNTLWAELTSVRGHGEIAAESFSQLVRDFPEEEYFHKKRIELEARRGRYEQGLALMMKSKGYRTEDVDMEELIRELISTDDVEELLTLARLLWGNKQQEKALNIYQHLLAQPVSDELSNTFRENQINYPYFTRENTFWSSLMNILQSEPGALEELMEPQFLIENRGNEAGRIVSEFYEQYSWQKLINNEYMARKAIFDRNYYYAEQSYKRLLEENSSEGMIDLATIYGKIGKYRKEAQMYEAMQRSGTSSPDLLDSIERNTLLISPQSIFNTSYEEKNGRNGNIDIAKTSIGTSFWFAPDLSKDIQLFYANNRFESLDTDKSSGSNLVYAVAIYEFTKDYELVLGVGTEKLNGNNDTSYQYEIELKGQLDDYVNAYVLFEKRQVYDTIAAIEQQISFQSIETGLSIETPVGLSFGGDLYHRAYSDDNAQNGFHAFSSYTLFGDSLQFALRYDYQYLINEDRNSTKAEIFANNTPDEVVYWSPSSFTEHRFGVRFQHDFLGFEQGAQKSMSYYAIGSAFGFEDNENISFNTNFDIFLEMSPRFLLKGNFTLSVSDDYEEKGLSVSLHYRW